MPWEYAPWTELAETGWALVGPIDAASIVERTKSAPGPRPPAACGVFGEGDAGERIVASLLGACS